MSVSTPPLFAHIVSKFRGRGGWIPKTDVFASLRNAKLILVASKPEFGLTVVSSVVALEFSQNTTLLRYLLAGLFFMCIWAEKRGRLVILRELALVVNFGVWRSVSNWPTNRFS